MDPLEQVAILGNHPYLLRSLSFSMKSSFIMETTSISRRHISRQVSLVSFATGMSVFGMTVRISSVHYFKVPLCDCTDTRENQIGSQGNTHTHTHCCLRVMMYRLHIVVLHPHYGTFWPLESPGTNIFFLTFFWRFIFKSHSQKEGSMGVRGSLRKQGRGTGTHGNSTCSPMFPEHVPRTLREKPSLPKGVELLGNCRMRVICALIHFARLGQP